MDSIKNLTTGQWIKIGAAATGLGLLWYLTSPAKTAAEEVAARRSKKVQAKDLVAAYKDLASEFHALLVDLAFSIQRVANKMYSIKS